jgi:UDP-N-acetylmuramate dehydrogenase
VTETSRTRTQVALSGLTTLRVGGPARTLVTADMTEEVLETLAACDAAGDPVLVLGAGSNLVVADAGFAGTALSVRTRGVEVAVDGDHVRVAVAAGEPWDDLVARAVAEGWAGLEALSGIPGLVGATPVQNVGAYGHEVASCIVEVDVLDRATGLRTPWPAPQCGFGYRTSRFKRATGEYVVLGVVLRLRRTASAAPVAYQELADRLGVELGATAPAAEVREAVLALRRGKGMVLDDTDHDTWSVGSFFVNPVLDASPAATLPDGAPRWPAPDGRVKTSAAWLIERAGFARGFGGALTGGRASLSSKHTLAVTNRGAATTADVLVVARAVRDGVRERFGIVLEPEPTLVGCHL